jgi:pimeloyl-ACP methyl ester carboxylesterase
MAFIDVNGTSLYYKEAGLGEPLLLVHGTGFNADVWDQVFENLARDYRTIVYDRRAYQRSQGSPPPASAYGRQQAEDIAALLEALGAAPASILGWSAGGIFALHATLLYPGRVKRLILYEPPLIAPRFIDLPFLKGIIKIGLRIAVGRKEAAAKSFTQMVLAYQDGRNSYDQLSTDFRARLAVDTDTLLAELMAVARDNLRPEMLSTQIRVPVTLLIGEQSPSSLRKAAEYLARTLRDASPIYLRESNHLAQVDQPDRFVRAVREALIRG